MDDQKSKYSPALPDSAASPDGHALSVSELAPIQGTAGVLEALLRRPRGLLHAMKGEQQPRLILVLTVTAAACAILYGLVVGTFSGGIQIYAAPLKIAAGLLVSAALCLPSLYVFNCLGGSSARLGEVAGVLAGSLALALLLLFSFAPVAWVFSQSTNSVGVMGMIHVSFWLVALYFGSRLLLRGMCAFGARSGSLFYTWWLLFVLVSLQMATALRPLVGTAHTLFPQEKKFFLAHWIESF